MPIQEILAALSQIGRLKDLLRSGWLREGIARPESVAAHSFRTALLALAIGDKFGVDVNKLVKMLLVHDLGESDPGVGDITPFDGISAQEKYRLECEAIDRVCAGLPNGTEMRQLWREYEDGRTPEAAIARQLDALELALQASEYERAHGIDLAAMKESVRRRLTSPILLEIYAGLIERAH